MKLFWIGIILILCSCKGPILPPSKTAAVEQDELSEIQKQNQNRFVWQEPAKVISMLGDLSNKTVADIGAGTGYFTFRLLFKAEKVIAIDIDPSMLEIMENFKVNLDKDIQDKLETRLALPSDSKLVDNEVDDILIINTIGYIDNRIDYLKNLKPKLKEGGRIMIVDFKSKQMPFEAPTAERIPLFQMENDLQESGYTLQKSDDTSLEYQYIIIASK